MLSKVKLALRITTDAFDSELNDLISACLLDLQLAGVIVPTVMDSDALVVRAVVTYCRYSFGSPDDTEYRRLKESYDEQKSQLSMATGYTTF